MNVYLAGKISEGENDWRSCYDEYRPFSVNIDDVIGRRPVDFARFFGELPIICKYPYIKVTGPFFISCNHGCYHGEGTHGVGAPDMEMQYYDKGHCWPGCCGGTFSQREVTQICKYQIARADMVFAYINSDSCFGTIFEIGYAVGIKTPVAVMFDTKERREAMWFLSECADLVFVSEGSGWKELNRNSFAYIKESVWLANRIIHHFHGKPMFRYQDRTMTDEESVFYPMVCHLPTKDQYQEYLKTDHWQAIRKERLKIDSYKCACCGTEKNVQVHHTDYSKGWFHEDPHNDLITLCKKCHTERVHGIDE